LLGVSFCGYVIANIGNIFKRIKFMAKTNKKNDFSIRLIHPF
jgi:hypothetical protein